MGQHVLTFIDLKNEAAHAISGTPDSRTSLARIVNGAIEYLCQFHPWSWRTSITTLSTVAGQAHVDLPADFGRILDLQPGTLNLSLNKATMRRVMAARVHLGDGLGYLWAIGQSPQTDPSVVPGMRLEIGPKPAADTTDAFMLVYRRLIPVLVADTDVPAIPYGFFELLRVLVRAWAVSNTIQQSGHDWELFNRMVGDYTAADGMGDGENSGALPNVLDDLCIEGEDNLRPGVSVLMPGDF